MNAAFFCRVSAVEVVKALAEKTGSAEVLAEMLDTLCKVRTVETYDLYGLLLFLFSMLGCSISSEH